MRKNVRIQDRIYGVAVVLRDGARLSIQTLTCGCPGCTATFEKTNPTRSCYATEAMAKFARRKGWTVNTNSGRVRCPAHGG